ncbi:hypothetical protein [Candidatus Nanohalovita haloferacivicina]|uniref:hypothetical protein n=1 Tax=Candidatus Nanohalovita haloferacivicina TaxID=2978046 RepID=UPI00325FB2CB|nr:hypothetical protein HBNXNv_0129 [Candidatus Nanohalobia archaeon BNXNv]
MRILSDNEDKELRDRIREEFGIRGDVDSEWEPIDIDDFFRTDWHEQEKNRERLEEFIEMLKKRGEKLFMIAYPGGQYVPSFQETFEEKYDSKAVEIDPEEISEIREDLITFYVVPEDLSWIFLGDHEGSLQFAGEIREEAEKAFGER